METTQQLQPTKENILKLTKNGLLIFMFFIKGLRINGTKIKNIKNPFYNDMKGALSITLRNDKWCFYDFGDSTYKGDCFEFAKLWYRQKEGLELKFNDLLNRLYIDLNSNGGINSAEDYKEIGSNSFDKPKSEVDKPFKLFERQFNQEDEKYFSQYGISLELLKDQKIVPIDGYEYFDINSNRRRNFESTHLMYAFKGINNNKPYAKIYRPNPKFFSWVGSKPSNYIFGTELLCAVEGEGKYIIITAGEKDVLTLLSLGYNAICFNSETCDAPKHLSRDLYESHLVPIILYDIDETGLKRGAELALQLNCKNVVLPKALKEEGGKDVSDWIKLGLPKEWLHSIINDSETEVDLKATVPNNDPLTEVDLNHASEYQNTNDDEETKEIYTGEELLNYDIKEIPTLIKPILQKVGLIALGGSSDTGKSSFLRHLASAISTNEQNFLGFEIQSTHKSCIYVSTEDDKNAVACLVKKQNTNTNYEPHKFEGLRFIFNSDNLISTLEIQLNKKPADLIIIDAYSDIFSGEINQVNQVRSFLENYSNLAKKHKCLIIFLHHTSKNAEGKIPSKNNLLGSQGFEAKMRTVLELRIDPTNDKLRHLCIVKGNYLPKEYKNQSFELEFTNDMTFENTGNRVPFYDLLKQDLEDQKEEDLINEIKKYRADNLTIIQIAEKTGVSKSKIGRLVKDY